MSTEVQRFESYRRLLRRATRLEPSHFAIAVTFPEGLSTAAPSGEENRFQARHVCQAQATFLNIFYYESGSPAIPRDDARTRANRANRLRIAKPGTAYDILSPHSINDYPYRASELPTQIAPVFVVI